MLSKTTQNYYYYFNEAYVETQDEYTDDPNQGKMVQYVKDFHGIDADTDPDARHALLNVLQDIADEDSQH